jgi:Phage integrase, N-terminal SAM-like domain
MSPSPLRIRMIEDMNLAGLASSTQALYIDAVYRLAAHYRRSPAELSEEEVRSYLVGLRDLYRHTLDCDWTLFSKKNSSTETKAPAPCAGRQSGPRSAGLRKEPGPQDLLLADVRLRPAVRGGHTSRQPPVITRAARAAHVCRRAHFPTCGGRDERGTPSDPW